MSEAAPALAGDDGGGDNSAPVQNDNDPGETTEAPATETPTLVNASVSPTPTGYDWGSLRQTLPDAMRDSTILDHFNETGFQGLVNEHINLQRLVGGEKVTRPTENSPQEDWDRFYNTLGRPEAPEGYDLGDFAPPEDLPWNGDLQDKMLGVFHAAGLSDRQAREVMDGYLSETNDEYEGIQNQLAQSAETSERNLRQEWGTAFEANKELSVRAFKATFGDNFADIAALQVDGQYLGDHPVFIHAFHALGSRMAEDGFATPGANASFAKTPEQAQAEIAELEKRDSVQQALTNQSHDEHSAMKRRMAALYAAAYPEE